MYNFSHQIKILEQIIVHKVRNKHNPTLCLKYNNETPQQKVELH